MCWSQHQSRHWQLSNTRSATSQWNNSCRKSNNLQLPVYDNSYSGHIYVTGYSRMYQPKSLFAYNEVTWPVNSIQDCLHVHRDWYNCNLTDCAASMPTDFLSSAYKFLYVWSITVKYLLTVTTHSSYSSIHLIIQPLLKPSPHTSHYKSYWPNIGFLPHKWASHQDYISHQSLLELDIQCISLQCMVLPCSICVNSSAIAYNCT